MSFQKGAKEVVDFTVLDFSTQKPFAFLDYAELTENELKGNRQDIRGGRGLAKVMSFDGEMDSSVKVTLPLLDLKMLGMLLGDDLKIGAKDVFEREVLTVDATNKITLSKVPIDGTVYLADLQSVRDFGKEITKATAASPDVYEYKQDTTDKKIFSFNATSHEEGTKVVATYMYSAPATSKTFKFRADKFPKMVTLQGSTIWRDQETDMDTPVKVTYHKAKSQLDVKVSMNGKDAAKLEMTFDLYPVDVKDEVSGEMGKEFASYTILE